MEIDDNTKAFGFVNKDAEDLYKACLVIIDAEFQNELERLMNVNTVGEARVHASGRCSGLNDILRLFQANRDFMKSSRMDGKQSNPTQSVLRD